MIIIPYTDLNPETLNNFIEEFVTRDGTEFTSSKLKKDQVLSELKLGRAKITFDEDSQTTDIIFES